MSGIGEHCGLGSVEEWDQGSGVPSHRNIHPCGKSWGMMLFNDFFMPEECDRWLIYSSCAASFHCLWLNCVYYLHVITFYTNLSLCCSVTSNPFPQRQWKKSTYLSDLLRQKTLLACFNLSEFSEFQKDNFVCISLTLSLIKKMFKETGEMLQMSYHKAQ